METEQINLDLTKEEIVLLNNIVVKIYKDKKNYSRSLLKEEIALVIKIISVSSNFLESSKITSISPGTLSRWFSKYCLVYRGYNKETITLQSKINYTTDERIKNT